MCWHKWSKWEEYKREQRFMYTWGRLAGKEFTEEIHEQKRYCLKCGKVQVERIYH